MTTKTVITITIGHRAFSAAGLDDAIAEGNHPLNRGHWSHERGSRGHVEVTLQFADAKEFLRSLQGCPAAQGKSGGYAGDPGDTAAVKRLINKLQDTLSATRKAAESNG